MWLGYENNGHEMMITCHFVKSLVSNHLLELLRLQDLIHRSLDTTSRDLEV